MMVARLRIVATGSGLAGLTVTGQASHSPRELTEHRVFGAGRLRVTTDTRRPET